MSGPVEALICLARPQSAAKAYDWAMGHKGLVAREIRVETSAEAFLVARPNVVVEAAGHKALAEVGATVLNAGVDLVVSAVGALSDDAFRLELEGAARGSGAALIVSPGAIGGLDILAAAKLSGLSAVRYTSRKPPLAWSGTKAEELLDLAGLRTQATFFEGSARDAARLFPQNANVAATIALAGAGMDETHVRLIADPAVARNQHEIEIRSACADVTLCIEGRPAPTNPKTSATTGYALAHILLERLNRDFKTLHRLSDG
jgi:aspartate dehydrogenase